jgi:hypothetical protein
MARFDLTDFSCSAIEPHCRLFSSFCNDRPRSRGVVCLIACTALRYTPLPNSMRSSLDRVDTGIALLMFCLR